MEISWVDWSWLEKNADLLRYFRAMIDFRHRHPALAQRTLLRTQITTCRLHELTCLAPSASWCSMSRPALEFMLCGRYVKGGLAQDEDIFVALNMHWEGRTFISLLPKKSPGSLCQLRPATPKTFTTGSEARLDNQAITLTSRSVVVWCPLSCSAHSGRGRVFDGELAIRPVLRRAQDRCCLKRAHLFGIERNGAECLLQVSS